MQGLVFPEGPAVDSKGNIWFVELKGGNLGCLSPDQTFKRFPVANGSPNGIAIDRRDHIWFCDSTNNCVSRLNPETLKIDTVCSGINGQPLHQPCDLAFDRQGTLVFTCHNNSRQEPTGYVCAWSPDDGIKKISDGKFFPNGLVFTSDGKELIIAETYKYRLWKGKWDAKSKTWYDEHPWVEAGGPIGPDGMAFSKDGDLYVAVYGRKTIKVISPQGIIIDEIELPGQNPTNCAFLPDGGLIVTEAERGELLKIDNRKKGMNLFK